MCPWNHACLVRRTSQRRRRRLWWFRLCFEIEMGMEEGAQGRRHLI